VAGLAPLSTKKADIAAEAKRLRSQEVTKIGQRASNEGKPILSKKDRIGLTAVNPTVGSALNFLGDDFLRSAGSGLNRAMFGLPERATAALVKATGQGGNLTYDEILQATRAQSDAEMGRSLAGNITGQIAGSIVGGSAAVKGVQAAGRKLASSRNQIAKGTGNVLQRLTTLKKADKIIDVQRAKNLGKIVLGGAAGGAAQAAGEGSDIGTGAAYGAGGAAAITGLLKAGGQAYKSARNALGREPVESVLSRYVKMPVDEIMNRVAARQAKGQKTSIYEVLDPSDAELLDDAIAKMPANSRQRLADAVKTRVGEAVQETSSKIKSITKPKVRDIQRATMADLAASRGATQPTLEEAKLAIKASRSPADMARVAQKEASNIMRPYDDIEAYESVADILPQAPTQTRSGSIKMVDSDPDLTAAIKSAASDLRLKPGRITISEVTQIMSKLGDLARKGEIKGTIARRASDYLEGKLGQDFPDASAAVQKMRTQYSARWKMIDGMAEGRKTRLRENIDVSDAAAARKVERVYGTPEATQGRALGQAARLEQDLLVDPDASLRAMNQIARNPTQQQAISRNLGGTQGAEIADVANTQSQIISRLARLATPRGGDPAIEPVSLMQNLLMLSPNTLPATKIQGIARLVKGALRVPERQADELINMLFSANPTQIARAVKFLNDAGPNGKNAIRSIAREISIGQLAAPAPSDIEAQAALPPSVEPDMAVEEDMPMEEDYAEEDMFADDIPYGRQVIEDLFPEAVITDDIRDPNSSLGMANPDSWHVQSDGAVDVRPIPGMTFEEFVSIIQESGYDVIEAIDEVNNPSGHATGPHWHVVIA